MTKSISILFFLFSIFIFSCKNENEEVAFTIPDHWEMIEQFTDETPELNEGGYYGLYYNRDNPHKDSLFEDSDDRIVAVALSDDLIVGKSKAIIWVADSKQELTLTKEESEGKQTYHRTYENEYFTVELNMRFFERIDGMNEEDMYIYSGKMKVIRNDTKDSQEFRVKGGI